MKVNVIYFDGISEGWRHNLGEAGSEREVVREETGLGEADVEESSDESEEES